MSNYSTGEFRKIQTCISLTKEQRESLDKIAKREQLSMSSLIREGIEMVISLYGSSSKDSENEPGNRMGPGPRKT